MQKAIFQNNIVLYSEKNNLYKVKIKQPMLKQNIVKNAYRYIVCAASLKVFRSHVYVWYYSYSKYKKWFAIAYKKT